MCCVFNFLRNERMLSHLFIFCNVLYSYYILYLLLLLKYFIILYCISCMLFRLRIRHLGKAHFLNVNLCKHCATVHYRAVTGVTPDPRPRTTFSDHRYSSYFTTFYHSPPEYISKKTQNLVCDSSARFLETTVLTTYSRKSRYSVSWTGLTSGFTFVLYSTCARYTGIGY